jgi:hypothetical protein
MDITQHGPDVMAAPSQKYIVATAGRQKHSAPW